MTSPCSASGPSCRDTLRSAFRGPVRGDRQRRGQLLICEIPPSQKTVVQGDGYRTESDANDLLESTSIVGNRAS
jgi:hypothetical protein